MALDAEYFDSIYIEVVKRKYYDAAAVQNVFAEIRRQAEELHAENARLRQENAELKRGRGDVADMMLSAQTVYQEILDRAREKADAITAEAEEEAAAIVAESRRQSEQMISRSRGYEDRAARRVEDALNRMKGIHQQSLEQLDRQWQDFLCSLGEEAETPVPAPHRAARPSPPPAPEEDQSPQLPPDLEEKVGAIAEELFSLESEL